MDGPGAIRFEATARMFVQGMAASATFILPDADCEKIAQAFGIIILQVHDREVPSIVISAPRAPV